MLIKIDLKIFIFSVIFYFTKQLKLYFWFMIFAGIHELSHAIVAKILGFKINLFEVDLFGFSIELHGGIRDYNKKIRKSNMLELKKIFVYLIGPFVNLIIACILNALRYNMELIYINVLLFLFNLIPMLPLDGGRIFKSLLLIIIGNKAYDVQKKISLITYIGIMVTFSIVILYFKNFIIFFIAVYLTIIYYLEDKRAIDKIENYKALNL